MILADIGNTRVHIYEKGKVIHLSYQEAIDRYQNQDVYYISVKSELKEKLEELNRWVNISDRIILKGSYATMGVDRKALCLSKEDGIFISAGSAITVDIMEAGEYQGGFLLLGISQYIKSYSLISSQLTTTLNRKVNVDKLPKSTQDGISYGIIGSIQTVIERHQQEKRVYISGGDGEFLSSFLNNAIFDESLIFQGMIKAYNIKFV
jgi:type III pantothenate kinase